MNEPAVSTNLEGATTIYRLDADDCIVSVQGPWDEFAVENGGVAVCACDVSNRCIWDFVTGDATRMWLDAVFRIARVRNETLERPYRCDSPEIKRFMRMSIVPSEGGAVEVRHHLLAIEKRSVPVAFQCVPEASGNALMLRCSLCGRVRERGGDSWKEPSARTGEACGRIVVAYSVCGECSCYLPGAMRSQAGRTDR